MIVFVFILQAGGVAVNISHPAPHPLVSGAVPHRDAPVCAAGPNTHRKGAPQLQQEVG